MLMIGGRASTTSCSTVEAGRTGAAEAADDSAMMQVCMAMSAAMESRTNQRIHM
ncbi:hypothetical protein ACFXJ8_28710 [Nonomuraea sp. NPDC059194]|uniref:hypothetical protein n=1 Tax=Nonomuraea sp. NPDC059194 TaxID=3346764 RepID=UPI0036ABF984